MLRLPWCVDQETLSEPIQVSAERHRIPQALQLRVRDVEDERVREALSKQIAKGEPSLVKIESIVAMAKKARRPPRVEDSEGFWIDGELTLMEGCHRTCATYLLAPSAFELQTLIATGVWDAYFDSELRVT